MKRALSLTTAAALILLPLTASAKELTGPALVDALSGKSFDCAADGKPMQITFGKAKKNGSVNYRGKFGGRPFSASYKMDKNGRYTQKGRPRAFHSTGKGQISIISKDLPKADCTVK